MSFSSSLQSETSAHPTLKLTINYARKDCHLYVFQSLPPLLFTDPYELRLYSEHYTFEHYGTRNLELPVVAVDTQGSSILLDVELSEQKSASLDITVPLHVRYPQPLPNGGYTAIDVPAPTVFTSCNSSGHVLDALDFMPTSFSSLFDASSSITFLSRTGRETMSTVRAPAGSYSDLEQVKYITTSVVLFAFVYLVQVSFRTSARIRRSALTKKE